MGVLWGTPVGAVAPARAFSGLSRRIAGRFPACMGLGAVPCSAGAGLIVLGRCQGGGCWHCLSPWFCYLDPARPRTKFSPVGGEGSREGNWSNWDQHKRWHQPWAVPSCPWIQSCGAEIGFPGGCWHPGAAPLLVLGSPCPLLCGFIDPEHCETAKGQKSWSVHFVRSAGGRLWGVAEPGSAACAKIMG